MPNTVNPPVADFVSQPALHYEHFNRKFTRICNFDKDSLKLKITSVDVVNHVFFDDVIDFSKLDDALTIRQLYTLANLLSSK